MLERHKLEKGKYPEKLAELEGNPPTDPYTGRAYLYSTLPGAETAESYQVYGVGWNLKDDGGKIVIGEWGGLSAEQGDLVWRYSPPPTLLDIPKPGEK